MITDTAEKLASRVQEGDNEAFGFIIDLFEKPLNRYASKLLGDSDAAEDVVQETFIKAYRDIQSFDINRKFSSWLYRIAHNSAIDHIRKNRKQIGLDEASEVASDVNLHLSSQDKIDKKKLGEILLTAISKIPAKYREPVILRFYEEREYEEISEILRIPIGTVGTYLSRAKVSLRNCLGDINIEDYL